jgi:hypothetical protein
MSREQGKIRLRQCRKQMVSQRVEKRRVHAGFSILEIARTLRSSTAMRNDQEIRWPGIDLDQSENLFPKVGQRTDPTCPRVVS